MSRYLPVANSRLLEVHRVTCNRTFVNFVFAATPVIREVTLVALTLTLGLWMGRVLEVQRVSMLQAQHGALVSQSLALANVRFGSL
jgi:hypothetical protein